MGCWLTRATQHWTQRWPLRLCWCIVACLKGNIAHFVICLNFKNKQLNYIEKLTLFNCFPGNMGPIKFEFDSMLDDVYTLCASISMKSWSDIFCATLLDGFNWLPSMCVIWMSFGGNTFISFIPSFPTEWFRLCDSMISELGELGGEFLISVRGVIDATSYTFDCAS